jgi:hypothetical protein
MNFARYFEQIGGFHQFTITVSYVILTINLLLVILIMALNKRYFYRELDFIR